MANQIADKNWYLDENKELTDDESKAAFRLVNEGQEIDANMAAKYDFSGKKVARQSDTAKEAEAPADEKAAAPKANKSAAPAKNKGVK